MDHLNALSDLIPFSRPTTPGHPLRLGFVGIGAMGYLMARNLALAAKHRNSRESAPLLIWNRTESRCTKLQAEVGEHYIQVAKTLEQVATECDIILTNLANDTVVKDVYDQFCKALTHAPSLLTKIFVETSTIYPHLAGKLDSAVSVLQHCHFIACPVFGAPAVADKAQLLIVMSGEYHCKKEVGHLLVPSVGRKIIDLGGNVEKAPTFKLIGNSMILGSVEIIAEAYAMADKTGIGAASVNTMVKEILPAPGLLNYSDRMANNRFDGSNGFAVDGAIKDAAHIRHLTEEHNSPMPVIDIVHQHLVTARALHNKEKLEGNNVPDILDWSGIVASTRAAASLDAFNSPKNTVVLDD